MLELRTHEGTLPLSCGGDSHRESLGDVLASSQAFPTPTSHPVPSLLSPYYLWSTHPLLSTATTLSHLDGFYSLPSLPSGLLLHGDL